MENYKIDIDSKVSFMYAKRIPSGFSCHGTITRDYFNTGILIKNIKTGIYVQLNSGSISTLDQSKVNKILKLKETKKCTQHTQKKKNT